MEHYDLFPLLPRREKVFALLFPYPVLHASSWRKQTEQAPSWKQDSISGQTVDFELYAQYLWKQHTNWKTRPPPTPAHGRAPGLVPRLSITWNNTLIICVTK